MGRQTVVQKKGLGKGLSALIPEVQASEEAPVLHVDIDRISPNRFQPRRLFQEETISELAASVKENGIIQPLLVRQSGGGYELIAGERRLRAALKAGLKQVPVVLRQASDQEALQLALIENIQRQDLNAIEEASAYRRLQEEFNWSQEEIAERVGKSRPAIANSVRLLLLPTEVQQEVAAGRLPAGQARALLGLQGEAAIVAAAREVIAKGLTTREAERLVRRFKSLRRRTKETPFSDPNLRAVVEGLQRRLGTRVRVLQRPKAVRGRIEIEYYSPADLQRIVETITAGKINPASEVL
ncbi:MAG: ParB/RepB/Spo0J family partition protein [Deltaproteobacteria bacterium]|nr:ParB/RepB/Spo0J family partition protein [Deltaproteobacteria bacterium]